MTQAIRSDGPIAQANVSAVNSAAVTANALVASNRGPTFNAQGLNQDLDAARLQSPAGAAALEAAVFAQLSPREQGELLRVQTQPVVSAASAPPGPSTAETVADLTQMALDIVGIIEPTPFADGSNALISLGRSIGSAVSGNWSEAGGHLVNGGLSAVGIFPYLGDAAKVAKIGKWAQTVADAVSMVARNPATRAALEGPLREIRDLVARIPQGAIDALPAGARESLERMKTQLDEFFAGGARGSDEVAQGGARVVGNTVVLDANRGASFTAGGRTQAIGDTPTVAPRTDGRQMVTDVNGDTHLVRRPVATNYDSRTINPDSTVTYTRDGNSVTYDRNGFPMFEAKADLYLSPSAINSGSDTAHFREANRMLGDALRADPGLAQRIGLNDDQVAFLTQANPAGRSPPDLTWHHHQDTGRIQLVPSAVHDRFSGGHTGGMRIWGGGR